MHAIAFPFQRRAQPHLGQTSGSASPVISVHTYHRQGILSRFTYDFHVSPSSFLQSPVNFGEQTGACEELMKDLEIGHPLGEEASVVLDDRMVSRSRDGVVGRGQTHSHTVTHDRISRIRRWRRACQGPGPNG
jgi:hypothetical protein